MQRRFALAAALAFTIVVTIGVVALGSQAGWFGHGKDAASKAAAQAVPPAQAPQQPPQPQAPVDAPPPDPIVRTEYVYIDEPGSNGSRSAAPAPAANHPLTQGSQPTALAAAPTDPAGAPTSRPSSTSPAAPTPTPPQAPPTTPPSAPTQTPASGGQSQPHELEFTGTVSAINGNVVTFLHAGNMTDVTVNHGLSNLSPGDVVHVHAIFSGGVYVATEIESGG